MSREDQAETLPVPMDCSSIPEFKYLVDRTESQLKAEALVKRRELQAQVDKASYETLCSDLEKDLVELQNYNRDLGTAKDLWADQVQSYKRNRRNKGLTKVGELMESRLNIIQIPSFSDMPKHYSMFKVKAAKAFAFAESDALPGCSYRACKFKKFQALVHMSPKGNPLRPRPEQAAADIRSP